ncbi:unnamed protein product, partial [marine sediment metagenome]
DPESSPQKSPLSLGDYPGHTTGGGAPSEELLANPEFVRDKAYEILAGGNPEEPLPPAMPLPLHQPLEKTRRFFERFEAPLPEVMEAVRKDDAIERPVPADPVEYGWRDILMEELRISRAEYKLLTDRSLSLRDDSLTLRQLYGFPPGTLEDDVLACLSNVKAFTRRMGITYEDVIEILKTRFVNPNSALLPRLERLGVPFITLYKLKRGDIALDEFNEAIAPHLDPAQYDGSIAAWVTDEANGGANYTRIMSLITLAESIATWEATKDYSRDDCVRPTSPLAGSTLYYECTTPGTSGGSEPRHWPTAPGKTYKDGDVVWTCRDGPSVCGFDKLKFCYADPEKLTQNIRAFEFVRMFRFIRLWRKLGWTIEQTDKAIAALYPADQAPDQLDDVVNLERLDNGFLTMLPRLGVVKRVMDALKLKLGKDLLPLLACFAPIDTHGTASLYRRMFLGPARDGAFEDDGYGH